MKQPRSANPAPAKATSESATSRATTWSQERRLQFIDFRLQWDQRLNRGDLVAFFSISVPQASTDIAQYLAMAPENLAYDRGSRMYVATAEFKAVYPTTGAKQYLAQLLAIERQVISPSQSLIGFRPDIASVPLPSRHIETATLLPIVRAIAERGMLEVRYQSIARDEPQLRGISPHAFGHDGLRWHVRAYCHLRNGFRDFVVGRILSVGGSVASNVRSVEDAEWHEEVEILLAPHPDLTKEQRHGVEVDYGMSRGKVSLKCRRALLYYTLRSLNFDSAGRPHRGDRQLVIANLETIKPLLPKPGQA